MRRKGWFGIGGLLLAGVVVVGCNRDRCYQGAPVTQPYASAPYAGVQPYAGAATDSAGAYGGAAPSMPPSTGSGSRMSMPQGSGAMPQGSGSR